MLYQSAPHRGAALLQKKGLIMQEQERRRQELLEQLAKRFRDSADTLKGVAKRINEASQLHQQTVRRMDRANGQLRDSVQEGSVTFTYLEYLEFASADEFRKFKQIDAITSEEIESIDWGDLCTRLTQSA